MPWAIHEEAMKKQMTVDVMRPQELTPEVLPENFTGTRNQGLPVKQIPHMDYPRVVYKHPKKLFMDIEHRNDKFEVVGVERVPTGHKTKVVNNEAELKAAFARGWVKEPYIPAPPPKPDAGIYDDDEDIPSLPPAPKRSPRGTAEDPL